MLPSYITDDFLDRFIASALEEDIGDGDHSTLAAIPAPETRNARLIVKDEGVLAGVILAVRIFQFFDKTLKIDTRLEDGASVKPGDIAFVVNGLARSILMTERLVLNCMQRMSGIATKTNKLTRLITGTGAIVLDTRKTTPNFRLLEKWAVRIGGGSNHRM